MDNYILKSLDKLEAESIYIIREAYASSKNPVMLYSIGKDSSVLLHLIKKAFYPAEVPFPLLHVDTGFKFQEMIDFRDKVAKKDNVNIIVKKSKEPRALEFGAKDAGSEEYIYHKKTKPLLEAIKENAFDFVFGGGRRDEEKSRAKERVFSHRDKNNFWDPKKQRPEIWQIYNTNLSEGENIRVFPLSNWTELDIWTYIKQEDIPVVPLYFAKDRQLVKRNGMYLLVDDFTVPEDGEEVVTKSCRFRTLGCSPSTGAVLSTAKNIDEVIEEVKLEKYSERQNRAIDNNSESSMEDKKKEGYF